MSDLLPFILCEEKQRIKEISGNDVSVVFDGTSRLGEAVVVLGFFDFETWSPQQRLVRLHLLAKTMCGDEIARELVTILSTELSIPPEKLLAAMRDRASSNRVAVRTLKVVYPHLLLRSFQCFEPYFEVFCLSTSLHNAPKVQKGEATA